MSDVEGVVHQTISVGSTATAVFGEDSVGSFMLLQNTSDTDMYLSFTGDAEAGTGILLSAGTNFLLDDVVIDSPLSAIHASDGQTKKLLVTVG